MKWIARLAMLSLLLAATVALLYLAAGAWLESAGGRQAVERELTQRAGMPVRLLGEFDIRLLPTLGVTGTELIIGGNGAGEAFLRSREYSVALALRPLLRGELQVVSLRLALGLLRLDRIPPSDPHAAGQPGPAPRLPAVGSLRISDFTLVFPGEHGYRLGIDELAIDAFEERRDTPYRIEAAGFGGIAGRFRWNPTDSVLGLGGTWSGVAPGDLAFEVAVDFATAAGQVSVRWPAGSFGGAETAALSTRFALQEELLRLEDIGLTAGTQTAAGFGCLLLGGTPSLRLDLTADALDFDRLPELPPFATAAGSNGGLPAGFDVALRLRAGELHRGGVVARNAVVSVGTDPDCAAPN